MKKLFSRTIKSKIILSTVILSILFSIMVCSTVYINYAKLLKEHMVEVTSANLRLVMDSMDEEFLQVKSLMEWGTINSRLQNILTYEEINNKNGREVTDFIEVFSDMINNAVPDATIEKVIIAGDTKISMQMGRINGSFYDIETCRQSEWFSQLYELPNITFGGLEKNEFQYSSADYIIPIVRPVYSYSKHKNVGFLMIGIKGDIPYKYIRDYSSYEDSQVIICNERGQIIASSGASRMGTYFGEDEKVLTEIDGRKEGAVQWKEGGKLKTAVYYKSPVTGWYMIQTLSDEEFYQQKMVIVRLIIFIIFGILAVAVLLSVALNHYINKPIRKIVGKIENISRGDFTPARDLETRDELGKIGVGINRMSENIVGLMDKSVEDEKNKRQLELKVLQTQINPHFLYNTLNSIKWMATIQKSSGIGEMASALSRLLRNIAKGVSDCISIREELNLMKDYITIQRYRYGESFKVEYDIDELLLDYKIPKFTLQPIIENAVFHGLEPKSGMGTIWISVQFRDEHIEIIVKDDGIGMREDEIQTALYEDPKECKDSLNGIGVKNVDERIKLILGAEYGISIKSVYGEYTKVIIRIPSLG